MKVSSLTFGRQCDYHTNPGRLQIRHALRAKHLRSRVFFFPMRLVRPSQDGERTVPLANMLFGAKKCKYRTAFAAARLPRSRRDATTLEINTRSIDCTLVKRPNICNRFRYIDLNDKTSL